MTEPIKPVGWLVLDPEGGYEYGCMDPDYGRDFCHDHIKDAQESGIPRARKWVVRESFSRDQVEQATAGLRAEVERLRAELSATTERLENRAGTVYALCAETVRLEAERDEARAKVESLRNALEAALDRIPHQCEGLDYAEADCPACQVKALAEEPTK
jgi:chromosome segregation ATPase